MRDRRFLLAARRDKEAFAEKEYGRGRSEDRVRLMQLACEKTVVYRPGLGSLLRTQLRYMGAWEYGIHVGGLLFVLFLTEYVQKKGFFDARELFAAAAVWMIFATVFFVCGLERAAANHMGELASACYFNLGQLVSMRLILGAAGQMFALAAFGILIGGDAEAGSAPMAVYLLLVWVLANTVYFFIFAAVRGRGQLLSLFAAALLLSAVVFFVSAIAEVLFLLSTGVCILILLLCVLMLGGELAYVFQGIKKGEILCFD